MRCSGLKFRCRISALSQPSGLCPLLFSQRPIRNESSECKKKKKKIRHSHFLSSWLHLLFFFLPAFSHSLPPPPHLSPLSLHLWPFFSFFLFPLVVFSFFFFSLSHYYFTLSTVSAGALAEPRRLNRRLNNLFL